jgi:outer membrane protein OmpA-like peptidoglycan-associated protein
MMESMTDMLCTEHWSMLLCRRASLLMLLLIASPLYAQDTSASFVLAGFGIGTSYGIQTSDVPVYAGSHECGEFEQGHLISAMLGGRLVLPSLVATNLGLDTRLRGVYSSGRLWALPLDPVRVQDGETGELVTLDREFRLESQMWSAYVDLLFQYSLDWMAVAVGPSLGFRLNTSFEQTDNILGPGDYRFPDGQPSHPMPAGPSLVNSNLAFGPMAVLSYGLPLAPGKQFTVEASARYELLSPVADATWHGMEFGAGIGLLFDITPSPEPPPPVVVVPAQPPKLTASIDVFAVDEHGDRIEVPIVRVSELLYRQHVPLLAAIIFEQDSSVVASRYVRLTTAAADSFEVSNLTGLSVLQIQHQALNVLGSRLRANPSAHLSLYGSIAHQESPSVARQRALAVRSYLENVWHIDSSRLPIIDGIGPMERSNEATEDGRADNRRVELASDMPMILAPVVTEEIERSFNPPILQLRPRIESEAGVKEWLVAVRQGEQEIGRFSSNDQSADQAPELVWDVIRENIDSTLSPVETELTVEDSSGGVVSARTQVPLLMQRNKQIVDKRIELHGDRERIAYSLVAFNFRSAELGTGNEAEIRAIATAIKPGATVNVVGYTDRIGDERHNVALSEQRAANVASAIRTWLDALGIANVTVDSMGAGIETSRFGNDLPEGRMLSRGVSVTIEQNAGEGEQ